MATPNQNTPHSAVGPALGYYYQAVYALLLLLDSEEDHAYISVESLDDVELNQQGIVELHQLKHSVNPNSKISVSSRELWSTMRVWCDFLIDNPDSQGTFFLVTVANIDESSELRALLDDGQPRDALLSALETEAIRIKNARSLACEGQKQDIKEGKQPRSLPFNDKYKGCEAFLLLSTGSRKSLIDKMRLKSGSFPISKGISRVENAIKNTVPHEIRQRLAKQTLAWWEREVIESLTNERVRQIYASEIKQRICELSAQLMEDGLTDNSEIIIPPHNLSIDKRLRLQLDLVGASEKVIQRSAKSEWRARAQRSIWTDGNLSLAKKIDSYDNTLVEEWQDQFDEAISLMSTDDDQSKIEVGNSLLSWSHFRAHKDLKPIRPHWTDPNLIRGSYQILSIVRRVGWHPDYYDLTANVTGNE